ncbi:MAG TPA: hypothetical protein VF331_23790 [Polyangiales bacterium]
MKTPRTQSLIADLPAWLAFIACFSVLSWAHWFFLTPPTLLHPIDEGYINAVAWRMADGRMLPFVDGVTHRGPLMYWVVALAVKLSSPLSWLPIRAVSMLCGIGSVALTFFVARRAGYLLAGALAALASVGAYVLDMWPIDGFAYSGEHLANVFSVAALGCLVVGLDQSRATPSRAWVAAAGAIAMLGALSKQTNAVSLGPLGLWVLAAAHSRPGLSRRARFALVGVFAGAAVVPVAITIARYALAGELRALVYYTLTYNSKVYLGPFTAAARGVAVQDWFANHAIMLGLLLTTGGWAASRSLATAPALRQLPRHHDQHGFVATVGLGALSLSLTSNAALRDFMHYYIQAVPWCGLLLGVLVEHALGSPLTLSGPRRAAIHGLILLPALYLLYIGTQQRFEHYDADRRSGRAFRDPHEQAVCAYVHAHSRPDQTLFIWGFWPQLYTECQRKPASRYVFTTFVSGFVPWFESATLAEDDARAVPGSRALLIADLEDSQPPILIDAPQTLGHRSMRRYHVLATYLDQHYCSVGIYSDFELFQRRDASGQCASVTAHAR